MTDKSGLFLFATHGIVTFHVLEVKSLIVTVVTLSVLDIANLGVPTEGRTVPDETVLPLRLSRLRTLSGVIW